MNLKRLPLLLLGMIVFMPFIYAQEEDWVSKMNDPSVNFYEVQRAFNDYWKDKTPQKGQGFKQYKRWEEFMAPRVYPSGDRSVLNTLWEEYNKLNSSENNNIESTGNWEEMGPVGVPINGLAYQSGGNGRLNCITFQPGNNQIIWVGATAGGLWKTTNGGSTWSTNTDFLPNLGVSDIAIHPTNSDTMYIATGDADAADTYSYGILRSVDGGITWATTGLTYTPSQLTRVTRIAIHPTNTNIIIATTSNGIFRSLNSGQTWTAVFTGGNFKQVLFKPGDPTVVYATRYNSTNTFFKSTNTGLSFVASVSGLPTTNQIRSEIAVHPLNPNLIYLVLSNSTHGLRGFFKSWDSGNTWNQMIAGVPNLLSNDLGGTGSSGQGWYDLALAVSPLDTNEIYVGGVNIWKSSNGGTAWNIVAHWYGDGGKAFAHADHHRFAFAPGTSTMFSCNDGGVTKTTDGGLTYNSISGNLAITQFYSVATAATAGNVFFGGAQDNGTSRSVAGVWSHVYGGDGMKCLVDYTNANICYAATQNGSINRSINGGLSYSNISNNISAGKTGAWVTPYMLHPTTATTIFAGYENVYRSTNSGTAWTAISTNLTGSSTLYLTSLNVAPSNANYIYASTGAKIWKTTNGGTSWTEITTGLPVGSAAITKIGISDTDPDKIWITFSGYSSANKVFSSTNGGSTYTNYSTGLPNVPINCVTYEKNTSDALYLGTDLGVYYRNSTLGAWQLFSQNLPNLIIKELEIQYANGKVYAATFGRGLWSSNLYGLPNDAGISKLISPALQTCYGNKNIIVELSNYSSQTLNSVTINWRVNNIPQTAFNWTGTLGAAQTTQVNIGTFNFVSPLSTYSFSVSTSNPNNTTDGNISNDSIAQVCTVFNSLKVVASVSTTPICSGGNSSLDAKIYSDIIITEVTQHAGGTGATSSYPPFINVLGTNDFLEISNISNSPFDVSGLVYQLWTSTSLNRTYSIPANTILPSKSVLILHIGTGTDDPSNFYFNTGGATDQLSSGTAAGHLIKFGSLLIDAVALNSYLWPVAANVSISEWSGNISSTSGLAGVIRVGNYDYNLNTDWSVSSSPPRQTIGYYNNNYITTSQNMAFLWSPSTFLNSAFVQNPTITNATSAQNYTVLITDPEACTANSNAALSINSLPTVSIGINSPICLNGNINLTSGGGVSYQWSGPLGFSNSSQNPSISSITNGHTGKYYVTVTDANTCSKTDSIVASITPSPNMPGIISGDTVSCPNSTQSFSISNVSGATSYTWSVPAGWSINSGQGSLSIIANSGTSTNKVEVSSVNGCGSSAPQTLTINILSANSWLGKTNTNWNDASNWCGSSPTSTTDIVIPGNAFSFPIISDKNPVCKNLNIQSGATLSIINNGKVSVFGAFVNNGTPSASNGTMAFKGNTTQSISSITTANLELDNPNGISLTGDLIVTDTLFLNNGKLLTNGFKAVVSSSNFNSIVEGPSNSNFSQSWIQGNLRRNIANLDTNIYLFPIGGASRSNVLWFKSDSLKGVSYLDASFGQKVGVDTGLNIKIGSIIIDSIASEGVWKITPDQSPVDGKYTLRLYFNGFSSVSTIGDNKFTIVERPNNSVLASDWEIPVNSFKPGFNKDGTTVASGYVERFNMNTFSEKGIGFSTLKPLPLQLLSFSATSLKELNLLRWTTANEINVDKFEIQLSLNGKDFHQIGTEKAKNHSQSISFYSFQHFISNNVEVFYRLKMLDKDGLFTYSQIVTVKKEAQNKIIVWPNPVTTESLIMIEGLQQKPILIELFDIQGKKVWSEYINVNLSYAIPNFLKSGNYIVKAKPSQGTELTFRFVKK